MRGPYHLCRQQGWRLELCKLFLRRSHGNLGLHFLDSVLTLFKLVSQHVGTAIHDPFKPLHFGGEPVLPFSL